MTEPNDARALVELGLGFWRSKVLLTAVELGVFTALGQSAQTAEELSAELGLHARGARDFFDALVALGLLTRDAAGCYRNGPVAAQFLDENQRSYLGGLFEMADQRLYPVWGKLAEALRTGQPQNEAKRSADYYANLMANPERLRTFLRGMSGLSLGSAEALAEKFPWHRHRTFADIGGARGDLAVRLAARHAHLVGTTFDLPAVKPHFDEHVELAKLGARLKFVAGDFFVDPLPEADVLVFGHVLHNWPLEQKQLLVTKAYASLPPGGRLIVYEALIDDERRTNAFGLLMSLNMLLVTSGGFAFTAAECRSWLAQAGFTSSEVEHLHGADWMVVAKK